jgi:hypothetical protein
LEGRPPAEDLALQWLIRDDPLQLLPDTEANKFRLTQRYAILTIWFQPADYDEAWVSTFGWLIPDEECKWYGMTCVDTDFGGDLGLQQEITGINMGYNNVHGTISSELGLLTHLESFVFTNSGFHGTIPDSLGLWTRLQTWDIRNSELTGTIPLSVENWTQIVNLYWTGTLLTGTVPRNLCKASTLYYHIADCPTEIICICCYNCPY